MRKKTRAITTALAVVLTLAFAIPAISASNAGSVSVRTPGQYLRGTQKITWGYTYGTTVKTNSAVDIQVTRDGFHWSLIASRVSIRSASHQWNTTLWPDAPYAIRARVTGTNLYSSASIIYLDNTAPAVKITRPSQGQVLVEDASLVTSDPIVLGLTTIQADSADNVSGMKSLVWHLDGAEIGRGNSTQYDFSKVIPGPHTLTALATDRAGNTGTSSINIIALPGASAADPSAIPSGTPSPQVSVPAVPEVPTIPPTPEVSIPPIPEIPEVPPTGTIPPTPAPSPSPSIPSTPTPGPLPSLPPLP